MAGWNIKSGKITEYELSEDRIWSMFNYVFSDSCMKRNTYKFGLIKALLDSAFDGIMQPEGVFYSYEGLFKKFTENYWNLVVKYDLRQMRPDGVSVYSKIEKILKKVALEDKIVVALEFDSINSIKKESVVRQVTNECKKYVIGALYADFEGKIYSFDLKEKGLILNECIYRFMLKYKAELERLNYYAWAKFLEKVNDDSALIRVIEKLELSTPHRCDLSIYREILRTEFEQDTCFYCGKKLRDKIHVDHFIPWSFIKTDKMWNFVLTCESCNIKKNCRVPSIEYVSELESRNKKLILLQDPVVQHDFEVYDTKLIGQLWVYAKQSGIQEYMINI